MAYKFIISETTHQTDAEDALGWKSAMLVQAVDGDGVQRYLRIDGSLKSDADIADAVEKAMVAALEAKPSKTSSLKAG